MAIVLSLPKEYSNTYMTPEHLLDMLQKIDFESKQISDIARAGQCRTLKNHSIKRMFENIQSIMQ